MLDRHRLPARDHQHRLLLDFALEHVDRLVLVDGGGGELRIATLQRLERLTEHLLGQTAHLGDLAVEERKFLLVRPDNVLVLLFHYSNS